MSQAAAATPVFTYDPFSYEAMHNPMPLYEVLREHYPAYPLPQYDAYAFSRFADVYSIFQNDASFHTAEGSMVAKEELAVPHRGEPPKWTLNPSLPILSRVQPALYGQVRQAMGPPLRPRAIAQLEADVRARTRALLEELLARGRFDVVKEFVGVIASGTVCQMCGIPVERAAEVLAAANFATGQDPLKGGFTATWMNNREPLLEICREAVRNRIAQGVDGSLPAIDGLTALHVQDRSMSVDDIAMMISSILLGGSETIPKVIAYGLMEIEKDPKQKAEILADLQKTTPPAFEEMLRFCGPAQWFMRTAKNPIVIAGQQVEVGQRVFALIQSANRDEREFPNADKFIWDRQITRHVGLGHGTHFCIGSHLARFEGRIILEELLSRVPDYKIVQTKRTPSSFQWGFIEAWLEPA